MIRFAVFSRHETGDVLETQRTSKAVAYEDRDLIQSILHRRAWVDEPHTIPEQALPSKPLEFVEAS